MCWCGMGVCVGVGGSVCVLSVGWDVSGSVCMLSGDVVGVLVWGSVCMLVWGGVSVGGSVCVLSVWLGWMGLCTC